MILKFSLKDMAETLISLLVVSFFDCSRLWYIWIRCSGRSYARVSL